MTEDRTAVGGFIEAMIAVIIVSSGLILLTLSFYMISLEDGGAHDLEEMSQEILQSILQDYCISGEHEVLLSSFDILFEGVPENGVKGFAVLIEECDPHRVVVICEGGEPYLEGHRYCRSLPVNVKCNPAEMKIALLSVWVW